MNVPDPSAEPPRRSIRRIVASWCVLGLAGLGTAGDSAVERLAAFDEVVEIVGQNFYDRSFAEERFPAIAASHRQALAGAPDEPFENRVNRMLGELQASHTRYYTDGDYGYYHLAGIFHFVPAVEALFPDGVTYDTIGVLTEVIDGKTFIVSVLAGSPGEQAGLLAGDEIVSADGRPFLPIDSLRGKHDQGVKLKVRRKDGSRPRRVTVHPRRLNPKEENLDAERESVRVIERDGVRIAYVHVWSYAGPEYQEAFEDALRSADVQQADALIWDLRFGWGGASLEYLRVFTDALPSFVGIDRDGASRDFTPRPAEREDGAQADYPLWRKPVAMLTNGRVRSGKELLAYGFRHANVGAIVGETTEGATLAGRLFVLSDGALLYLAVMDTRIDGQRLEGRGVEPDIVVPHDPRYAAGEDPQRERAIEWLIEQTKNGEQGATGDGPG